MPNCRRRELAPGGNIGTQRDDTADRRLSGLVHPDGYSVAMDGEQRDESKGPAEPIVPIEEQTVTQRQSSGIAWGFVAFVVFVALLAIFIFQNADSVTIELLWLQLDLSLWMVVIAIVLLTLIFDQIISFFYRRRKRKGLAPGTVKD